MIPEPTVMVSMILEPTVMVSMIPEPTAMVSMMVAMILQPTVMVSMILEPTVMVSMMVFCVAADDRHQKTTCNKLLRSELIENEHCAVSCSLRRVIVWPLLQHSARLRADFAIILRRGFRSD